MNENAQAWVKALRSGKYKQTREVLKDKNGYCCLGVACELYGASHPGSEFVDYEEGENTYSCFMVDQDDTSCDVTLSYTVRDWLGLNSINGGFSDPIEDHTCLAALNDDAGYDFDQIADVIESEPVGLFK